MARPARPLRGEPADVRPTIERWFLKRGLPHFIDDYRADQDVLTRALPMLGLVFFLQLIGAADLSWRWWQNALALLAALALAVGVWVVLNLVRHRAALARPQRVGLVEVAVFLFGPPVISLSIAGSWTGALTQFVLAVVVLALVYGVVSYGIIPMTRWAFGQLFRQLGTVLTLAGRALPLLLLICIALFVASDFWQIAAALEPHRVTASLAFLGGIAVVFLLARLPHEVGRAQADLDDAAIRAAVVGTPAADLAAAASTPFAPAALSRRQRGNILLVLLFSQAVQVVLVGAVTAAFFLVFGIVAVKPSVIDLWLSGGTIAHPYLTTTVLGVHVVVSQALLRVCALLGGIAAFYFAIYVITDATYREQFFEDILGQVRQSVAVRAVYHQSVAPAPDPGQP